MKAKRSGRPCQESTAQVVATTSCNSTPRPHPGTIIGAENYHRLILQGYRVTGICRSCGAPLTNEVSLRRGLGPVCAKQVA
jgi:hypothetical protein